MPKPPSHFSYRLGLRGVSGNLDVQAQRLRNTNRQADDIPAAVRLMIGLEVNASQKQHLNQR